jgi:hypothetical protein
MCAGIGDESSGALEIRENLAIKDYPHHGGEHPASAKLHDSAPPK